MSVTCPCGAVFEVTRKRYEDGRGRRCSKECQYRYMIRPSGMKYNVTKENPTSFRPGRVPWNKDVALKEEISYRELHRWVARRLTKTGVCDHCGSDGFTQWANKSHKYKRELDDWLELCRSCHRQHDSGAARGAATRKFGEDQVQDG